MLETHHQPAEPGLSARERILDAAYELFSRRGIQAVGVNDVTERAGVAIATLYRHFPSKDKLVLAFLDLRPNHPAGGASVRHLEQIRAIVRRLAEEAGLRDTDSFARSWHILMEGSIVVAAEGDAQVARGGKSMARQ